MAMTSMKFGRVIGRVVATQKVESLTGARLLVIQPLTKDLKEEGAPYVAADVVAQAGEGDIVFVVFSGDAPMAFDDPFVPVDAAVVGIVDRANLGEGGRG